MPAEASNPAPVNSLWLQTSRHLLRRLRVPHSHDSDHWEAWGQPLFPQLIRKASGFPTSMHIVVADGNYHSAKNHLEAHRLGASTVIPLPNRKHRESKTLARRLHPVIKRGSELYRRLKRKQQSIERVFSRLKNHFNLDNLRGKGLARVKQHALLSLTGMLVYALTAAKRGFESLVRSPTRLTI